MALASLWVLPVSFGIILATAGIMRIRQEKVTEVSIACSDGTVAEQGNKKEMGIKEKN